MATKVSCQLVLQKQVQLAPAALTSLKLPKKNSTGLLKCPYGPGSSKTLAAKKVTEGSKTKLEQQSMWNTASGSFATGDKSAFKMMLSGFNRAGEMA